MPRSPRIDIPSLVYHVTSRGVKRSAIFHEEVDRQRFMRLLLETRKKFPFTLHAYCLMTNHFHLLLQTLDASLSKTLQHFKGIFGSWSNRKYELSGHVFQGRFHSIPVDTDAYFTVAARYIHLNPVRAGMVLKPEDFPWSNYGRLIRGEADPLVNNEKLFDYFRLPGRDPGQEYRQFVEEGLVRTEPIDERRLLRMRYWEKPPVRTLVCPK